MIELDERGNVCPAPVIALGRAVKNENFRPLRIVILADDPAATYDIPAWCRMRGADLIEATVLPDGAGTRFVVVLPAEPT
ncbi:MAG: sulfurtransferase TusA family protein [Actinobacteria bacterium]|nr:sulfurtransferase TusA family protein [Actinomycetota bacterium]